MNSAAPANKSDHFGSNRETKQKLHLSHMNFCFGSDENIWKPIENLAEAELGPKETAPFLL